MTELDDVMARLEREGPEWLEHAYAVTHGACLNHPIVTTDMLWPHLAFPSGPSGGRLLGRAIRVAIEQGWMEKAKTPDGFVLCRDHVDSEPSHSQDGVVIHHGGPAVVYRSLVFVDATISNGDRHDANNEED